MASANPDYVTAAIDGIETARDQLLVSAKYASDAARKVVGKTVKTVQPDVQGALNLYFTFAEGVVARQRTLANSVVQSVNRLAGV